MRIYRHVRLVPDDGTNDIGRLPPDTRQAKQGIVVLRHLSAIVIDQTLGHTQKMAGLIARIRDGLDVFVEFIDSRLGHLLRCGKSLQEIGGDEVDPLIGALRREDYGHQQLKGVVVVQLGGGIGIVLDEIFDDALVSLLFGHDTGKM